MKKQAAVYTIVKNESYHLKKWIDHYKKYFSPKDIYILDHESDDGSTDGLDVNVVKVYNKIVFDHRWLNETVTVQLQTLLQEYECVLFSEVDELIYSVQTPLNERIKNFLSEDKNYVRCLSHNVFQNFEKEEKDLEETDSILEYRNYWSRDVDYDKVLLTKIPLSWILGFHYLSSEEKPEIAEDLFLIHIHYFDLNLTVKRHANRLINNTVSADQAGSQNKTYDLGEIKKMIEKNYIHSEPIPENHKKALKHI